MEAMSRVQIRLRLLRLFCAILYVSISSYPSYGLKSKVEMPLPRVAAYVKKKNKTFHSKSWGSLRKPLCYLYQKLNEIHRYKKQDMVKRILNVLKGHGI